MTFADKISLGQAAVLGILFVYRLCTSKLRPDSSNRKDTHLNRNQFNWLGTIFYLSYLAFEVCQVLVGSSPSNVPLVSPKSSSTAFSYRKMDEV